MLFDVTQIAHQVESSEVNVPVLTLSTPPAWVEHQPPLGLHQLHFQLLVLALQLSDLLLPPFQHPQLGVEVEQTLRNKKDADSDADPCRESVEHRAFY